jgi:hypothetical protein
MSVNEIQTAISQLPRSELEQLAAWFEQFQAERWDKQIESDLRAGRLDALIREAEGEISAGRTRPL